MPGSKKIEGRLVKILRGNAWVLARIASVVAYYVVGVCFYHATEDWTVMDSVYFVTVSVSTIGYGDLHPDSDTGLLFTSFYLIAGLAIVLSAVDGLARNGIVRLQNATLNAIFPDQSPYVRFI